MLGCEEIAMRTMINEFGIITNNFCTLLGVRCGHVQTDSDEGILFKVSMLVNCENKSAGAPVIISYIYDDVKKWKIAEKIEPAYITRDTISFIAHSKLVYESNSVLLRSINKLDIDDWLDMCSVYDYKYEYIYKLIGKIFPREQLFDAYIGSNIDSENAKKFISFFAGRDISYLIKNYYDYIKLNIEFFMPDSIENCVKDADPKKVYAIEWSVLVAAYMDKYNLWYEFADKYPRNCVIIFVQAMMQRGNVYNDDDIKYIRKTFFLCNEEEQILLTYLFLKERIMKLFSIALLDIPKDRSRLKLLYLLIDNADVQFEKRQGIINDLLEMMCSMITADNIYRGFKMDCILPVCTPKYNSIEEFYCEGKIKHEQSNMFQCSYYCPRDKSTCSQGANNFLPDENKPFFQWTIIDVMNVTNFWDKGIWDKYIAAEYNSRNNMGHYMYIPDRDSFIGKICGVFNRFNELKDVIRCRSCGEYLRFDLKYSPKFFAVYAVTHAYCPRASGKDDLEHDVDVYLSHCHNYRCRGLIDSRDLVRHSNGYRVCDRCGDYGETYPIGNICPSCLTELDASDRKGKGCHRCGHLIKFHPNIVAENKNITSMVSARVRRKTI